MPMLAVLFLLGFVSEFFPIRFPLGAQQIEVSMSTTFGFVVLFLYGLPVALVLQGILWLFGEIRGRKPFRKLVYNIGQLWVSMAGGNLLGEVVYGRQLDHVPARYGARYLIGAIGAVVVFLLINATLNVVVRWLAGGGGLRELAASSFTGEMGTEVSTGLIAVLAVALMDESWVLALVLLLPFAGMYKALLVMGENAKLAHQRETAIAEKLETEERFNDERQMMLDELGNRQQRLDLVTSQMPAILWTCDEDLRLTSNAGKGLEVFGAAPGDRVGMTLFEYFETEDLGFEPIAVHLEALKGRSGNYELEIDGRLWVTFVEPLTDASGKVVGTVALSTDSTDRRRVEIQTREAQKLQAIGELAGGIAHDFNNLLAVMRNYAVFAMDSSSSEGVREDLSQVIKAADKGANLVRQLLAFSSRGLNKPEVVDLNDVISDMLGLVRGALTESISVEVSLASSLPPVEVDPGQIEQVVMNLVVNARDAMEQGGRIKIETSAAFLTDDDVPMHETEPGLYVEIAISDQGKGIPEEQQRRIFEPFFTTKARGSGTGLGLATVYGIVQQARGRVVVDSEPGRGAAFRVFLPAFEGATAASLAPAEDETRERQAGVGVRVLVVEDEPAIARLAERILERAGYSVSVAHSPDEALKSVDRGLVPDVLLTDVVMPGMSGRDLAEHLVRLHPEVTVVYMSGYPDHALDAQRMDRLSFVPKPFSAHALIDGIERATGYRSGTV